MSRMEAGSRSINHLSSAQNVIATNPVLTGLHVPPGHDIDFPPEKCGEPGFQTLEFSHPRSRIVVLEDDQEIDVALGTEIVAQKGAEDGELKDVKLTADLSNLIRRQGDPVPGNGLQQGGDGLVPRADGLPAGDAVNRRRHVIIPAASGEWPLCQEGFPNCV